MSTRLEARFLDLTDDYGPFDFIGDVHGCCDELIALLGRLGYRVELAGEGERRAVRLLERPVGRKLVFVGDLVDRGPATPDVLRVAMALVATGRAWSVIGNHDNKFMRWLQGRPVKLTHGLDVSSAQMGAESDSFRAGVQTFLEGLPHYIGFAGWRLVVAHAGIKADMIGRTGDSVRRFCLFGDTDNELDPLGLPIRYHWAADYDGQAEIVYGHTPVAAAEWVNRTLCIDTGAVFGGALTALRWPEREIVSVPALGAHAPLRKPFGHPEPRPRVSG